MKKIIILLIILSSSPDIRAAGLKSYRETPLLNAKVQENILPFGEYSLIRSYRNVTQILISVNTKIILYTDRENQKDSEIFVTAYSRLEEVILNVPTIQQHEFNLKVEKLIRKGDSSSTSTIPFPGAEKFIEEIKKGAKPVKDEGEFFIYLRDNNRPVSLMTINLIWKKLTIRNILNEHKVPSTFYSIYTDECYDKNIKKILRELSGEIKREYFNNPS
ncbi:MAG: hypothetical protein CVV49_16940 [Spirochaetae bacterium HGW-Spirochaetae-5]|nr:MAG: hypothetical protein CVV49_16940 [Spirochaetae bacterium HGW-Spirochaetae-5]